MQQTEKVVCPHCNQVDGLDIFDLTENDDFEGEFTLECSNENCRKEYLVKFEFKPFVETKKIEEE